MRPVDPGVGVSPEQDHVWALVLDYLKEKAAREGNPIHIDEEPPLIRARFLGETRDFTTIWFTVGSRTLQYETYALPAPEDNAASVYGYLMRWNRRLYLASFGLDADGEVYLSGRIPLSAVTVEEVDHIVGQVYAAVEATFRTALRLGFPRHFA